MVTKEELEAKLDPYWSDSPVWRSAEIGEGWFDLVSKLLDDILTVTSDFEIVQIKEKFGGLRFYINPPEDDEDSGEIRSLIYAAEDASFKICEMCGKPGKTVGFGWLHTLCEEHEKE